MKGSERVIMEDDSINIRDIQHYMYCKRRFALLAVNRDWSENAYVIKANIMHERAHDSENVRVYKTKIIQNSVVLYNDDPRYNIFGVADSIEFERSKEGVYIPELDGRFRVKIVEYKPKPPKEGGFHESDAIQVYAQKLCADYVWKCDCEAYIYYADIRRRVKLPFDTEADRYDEIIREYLKEMHEIMKTGDIPSKDKGTKCSGCSIKDLCIPKKSKYVVRDLVESMTE